MASLTWHGAPLHAAFSMHSHVRLRFNTADVLLHFCCLLTCRRVSHCNHSFTNQTGLVGGGAADLRSPWLRALLLGASSTSSSRCALQLPDRAQH